MSKIFEKPMKKRIVDFVKATDGLDKRQFGFQENSNTMIAVINVMTEIINALDKRKCIGALTLFIKKSCWNF